MFYPFEKTDSLFYISLFFLVFPIGGVFLGWYPVWTLLASFAFIVAYLGLIHIKDEYDKFLAVLWVYLLVYIVAMSVWGNGMMIWFFCYPSNLLIWRFADKLKSYRMLSFLVSLVGSVSYTLLFSKDVILQIMAVIVLVSILVTMVIQNDLREREVARAKIYQQNRYINLLSAENERNRIGRDLHDSLGHTFSLMTLKLDLAQKRLKNGELEALEKELTDLSDVSRQSMANVRQLINEFYRSLEDELTELQEMLSLAHITVKVDKSGLDEVLSDKIQSHLVMILRELVTNIIKHSQATECSILLANQGDDITLKISDNGKGFSKLTGQELHSIKERMAHLNGTVTILSQKNPTEIEVILRSAPL